MAKTPLQLRGHCQRCGNQQAVRNGRIAHHGYVVRDGWFQGACSGYQYAPIEYSRTALDQTVEIIRDQITTLRESASLLSSPAWWPKNVTVYNHFTRTDEVVPLASLSEAKAKEVIRAMIDEQLSRARAGEAHIAYLREVAALYHGKPLIECARDEGPEPIPAGDKRIDAKGRILIAEGILPRGNVRYLRPNADGTTQPFRMSTRAWRALAKAS